LSVVVNLLKSGPLHLLLEVPKVAAVMLPIPVPDRPVPSETLPSEVATLQVMFWPVVVFLSTAFVPGLRDPVMGPPPVTDQVPSAKVGVALDTTETAAARTIRVETELFRMVFPLGWVRMDFQY
jgi:hypothetical protein